MLGSLALSAALLLTAAGVAKLASPAPAAAMLRRTSRLLAARRLSGLVRCAGAAETAIGLGVVAFGGRVPLLLMAGCYAAFAVVAVRLARSGASTSCGCFGRADSPVGAAHVALNLVCLAVAVAAAVRPAGALGGLAQRAAGVTVVGVGQAALLAYLGFLTITALPALAAARRQFSS